LNVNPNEHAVVIELIWSLLFQGKFIEAEKLLSYNKDELREEFMASCKELEKSGTIPEEYRADVEKIKKSLRKNN
jgi:hypothetical protein